MEYSEKDKIFPFGTRFGATNQAAIYLKLTAPVAQWIEHLTTDQKVGGSNPFGRAIPGTRCDPAGRGKLI